jgi:hypothetical protein
MKGNVKRNLWVIPYDRFKREINKKKD